MNKWSAATSRAEAKGRTPHAGYRLPGSFDLCVTRDGDLHWLELNPNGQWGWLEDETGLPIAAAFADLLEQGATP